MTAKRIAILGSTGSIGTQALDVVRYFKDAFSIVGISGNQNTDLLVAQAREFCPEVVVVGHDEDYSNVKGRLSDIGCDVLVGQDGLCELAASPSVEIVLASLVGFAGVRSVLAALAVGKTVALANKESLVAAGHLVSDLLEKHGGKIIPVDSEHSAIYQCLQGEDPETVTGLILTASGGPFRDRAVETFDSIRIEDALAHPNWTMGAKITIDSATMMNKGLEMIEAHWLFGVPAADIDVLIHRQSIIHSMVNFQDGSTKAQLGVPDMKVPIQYALTYPDRCAAPNDTLDWSKISKLDFEEVSSEKFPCVDLAYRALDIGGSMPAVMNAANEEAVSNFLAGNVPFMRISDIIANVMSSHTPVPNPTLDDLIQIDELARAQSEQNYAGTH